MGFAVSAAAYDRFMGRFSGPLASRLVDRAGVSAGARVLDVGSGPGALSAALVDRVGEGLVAAADPMPVFVEALRERLPGVTAVVAGAEDLPWQDATYDAVLANLVVPFMTDPVAGLREMARVTRPGGTVATTVWQHASGTSPLSPFWDSVRALDPDGADESVAPGVLPGDLARLSGEAGLAATVTELAVAVRFASFDEWWEPFTLGVGPAGSYLAAAPAERRQQVRAACARRLGPAPFTVPGTAWCAVATVERGAAAT
jgi:SAM-dependent methyltransferase